MANLRQGSTMGGIPIVTIDMINRILDDSGAENIGNKIDKIGITNLTTPTEVSQITSNVNKNGFYKYVGTALPVTGGSATSFTEGSILSLTTDNAKGLMQFFSPATTGSTGNAELYYKNYNSSSWDLLVTKSLLNTNLAKYLPLTGGTITGALTVNGLLRSGSNIESTNGYLKSTLNGNTVQIGSYNASYCHFVNSANIPFHFNKDVRVQGEIYAGTSFNQKVWHAGNFDPTTNMPKSVRLTTAYDLNTLIAEGYYQVLQAVNRPDKITNWAYVEVLRHTDDWILQKIYNFEGTVSYMRTKSNGVWMPWIPMGGGMTYSKTIAATTEWTLSGNMYQMTITHSLGSENILSVVLTDTAKYSMNIGFQVVDANKITVFCGENPTGKVVVNATV